MQQRRAFLPDLAGGGGEDAGVPSCGAGTHLSWSVERGYYCAPEEQVFNPFEEAETSEPEPLPLPAPVISGRRPTGLKFAGILPGEEPTFARLYPEFAPSALRENIERMAFENPIEFLKDLQRRGTPTETLPVIRSLGATDQDIDDIYGVEYRQAQLQALIAAVPALKGKTLDEVADAVETDPSEFIRKLQSGGATAEKLAFLRMVGLSDEEVVELFPEGLKAPVPKEKLWKDYWDAIALGTVETAHKARNFFTNTLPRLIPEPSPYLPPAERAEFLARNERWANEARKRAVENEQVMEDWLTKHPEMQPRKEWEGFSYDKLLNPEFLGYTIVSNAPATIGAMVAGGATWVLTGNPLLTSAAAAATFAPAQLQDTYEHMLASGATEEEALRLTPAIGMLITSLEMASDLPLLIAIRPVLQLLRKEIQRQVVKATVAGLIKQGTKTAGGILVAESLTEGLQEAIQNATDKFFDENKNVLEGVDRAMILALVASSPFALFGGATSMINVPREQAAQTEVKTGWQQDSVTGEWYMPRKLAEVFTEKLEEFRQSGLGLEQAKIKVLDFLTQTAEGARAIREFAQEFAAGETGAIGRPFTGRSRQDLLDIVRESEPADIMVLKEKSLGVNKWRVIDARTGTDLGGRSFEEGAVALREQYLQEAVGPRLPKAEVGMPEAGLQPSMLPEEVAAKEVFPEGRGKITQIDMDDQLKLEQARAAEVEEGQARLAGAEAEAEALKEWLATDPIANYRFRMGRRQVGLESLISVREGSFPEHLTLKQAKAVSPHGSFRLYTQKGTRDYNKVPIDALDTVAEGLGVSTNELPERVMAIRRARAKLRKLESELAQGVSPEIPVRAAKPPAEAVKGQETALPKEVSVAKAEQVEEGRKALAERPMSPEAKRLDAEMAVLLDRIDDLPRYSVKGMKLRERFDKLSAELDLEMSGPQRLADAKAEVVTAPPEAPAVKPAGEIPPVKPPVPPTAVAAPEPLPEMTPEEIKSNRLIVGEPTLTPEQENRALELLALYINSPGALEATELTRELRRQRRSEQAKSLQERIEELVVSQDMDVEQAINQAKAEILSGKLPVVTTDYMAGLTARMRAVFFSKLRRTLKDEPFEMISTETALVNALDGIAIPREPGTKGGSAYTRLQRVFGEGPSPVMQVIDKIASEKKPLKNVIEGVFRDYVEGGSPPIALDEMNSEYLRNLPSRPIKQPELGEADGPIVELLTFNIPSKFGEYPAPLSAIPPLPPDTRTAHQKDMDLQRFKLELTPDTYKDWTPERLEELSWLRVNLLNSEYQAKLIETKWIPPPAISDTRTPAQRALDLELFRIELSPTPLGVTAPVFEAPIADAFKQMGLTVKGRELKIGEKQAIVRILKNLGMTAIDIGNLLRANMASFDLSYYRQAKFLAAGHPFRLYRMSVEAWKALWSQQDAEAHWHRITRQDADFQIYDEIRAITGADPLRTPDFAMTKGTEQHRGAEEYGYTTGERPIPRFTGKIPWIKVSSRVFNTATNDIVWGTWKDKIKAARRRGQLIASGQVKLPEGEAFDLIQEMTAHQQMLADFIQRATLKAGTIDARGLAPVISAVFFAARSKLGRFLMPRHLISANPRVRAEAWKDFILFNAEIGGVVLLGGWLGLWETEDDPRNAEFMSIRIGNTRIDPWAGYRQFVVLYARLATETGVSSVTGAEYEVNKIGVVTNFFRSSLAPMTAILLDFWTGRNFLGQVVEVTNAKQWLERLSPFAVGSVWEAFEESTKEGAIAVLPAILGEGVSTYTGDWRENFANLGLPKYVENTAYGLKEPRYDTEDFWADTASQFKDVAPETLTSAKGFPNYIRAIAEARVILDHLDTLPGEKLVQINADPAAGTTFAQYYRMWQDRQKIVASGDKALLLEFDKDERTRNAYRGNFTQRQFALLNDYWAIADKKERNKFLEDHPELDINPRQEWLKSHPAENAQLAIWGKAKILSLGAYNEARRLIKQMDIPDSAIPEFALPPEGSVENYFKYESMDKAKKNSPEAKLLLAKDDDLRKFLKRERIDTPIASLELKVKNQSLFDKLDALSDKKAPDYISDDKLRAAAIKTLKDDNPAFVDDLRRIEAIEKNGEAFQEQWVERGKLSDKSPGFNAEDKLWLVDNPDIHQWAIQNKLLSATEEKWNIPVLRLDAKYRKEDAEYGAIKYPIARDEKQQRDAYLAKHPEYRKDRRRREAYQLTNPLTGHKFPEEQIEKYVAYHELQVKGKRQERYLNEHPDFAKEMVASGALSNIPLKVPAADYDDIYDRYKKDFDKIEGMGDTTSPFFVADVKVREETRQAMRFDKNGKYTPFGLAEVRREAYGLYVPENHVDSYMGYKKIVGEGKGEDYKLRNNTDLWFEDDWFLMNHPSFYKEVYLGILKNERRDYRKVPTRAVFNKYLEYINMVGKDANDFRWAHKDLDDWLVRKFGYRPVREPKKEDEVVSERDKLSAAVQQRLARIKALSR